MKKTFTLLTFILLCTLVVNGQRLSKREASQILNTAYESLQRSDTSVFTSLWHLDNAPWPYHERQYKQSEVVRDFEHLREFLDTAIRRKLPFSEIEVTRVYKGISTENFGKYRITGWFDYDKHYSKGFGFFVDYVNGCWLVRFSPETSSVVRSYQTAKG
jgi:hypothetical protein